MMKSIERGISSMSNLNIEDLTRRVPMHRKVISTMEPFFPDEWAVSDACYHLQQLVENELKAIILLKGENPSYTHDISDLAIHCKNLGVEFDDDFWRIADTITLWETKTRYGGKFNFVELRYKEAKQAEIHVCNVLSKILEPLNPALAKSLTEAINNNNLSDNNVVPTSDAEEINPTDDTDEVDP